VLGTGDYVRKCGFSKVLLGLSGGIDSALTAVIAARAVGPENVWGVTMPSRYSSAGSVDDSEKLAKSLGIRFSRIPIEGAFSALLTTLDPVFADTPPGIAEENLQARIRGTILMALSNKFGMLLLSTGNKSELAVGYSTLYGDMNGGLNVISDLPKEMVYQLAAYINRNGEVIPAATLTKPPSAELRPDQTDQDTLPPYPVLDAILERLIERGDSRRKIVADGFDAPTVAWIASAIARNEYKRRQAAPGLKVTSKAFGTGRRFPLAARYDWS
jgi:NAD+ synthetase